MNKEEMLQKLHKLNFPKKEYWIVAGSAMLLYGLRQQTHDIDMGCTKALADELEKQGFLVSVQEDGRRSFLVDGDVEISEDWLFDTVTEVEGFPVISGKGLLEMKRYLGREKDQKDILVIEQYLRAKEEITVQRAGVQDAENLTELALLLWPENEAGELRDELEELASREDAVFFLARKGETAVGFAQCQLRRDYVEGTESSPVGYLEGIYVAEVFRKQGIARRLLSACEAWAREKGCREFASDCELENEQSLRFHLGVGFGEANRIICFTKKL